MAQDPIVIAGAARTPMGAFQGALAREPAPTLAGVALAEATRRAGLGAEGPDRLLLGNVLSAGLGQAPARTAAHAAGLPDSLDCLAINKVCGSAMSAAMLGADLLRAGTAETILAGGMESMSNAPYLLARARQGYRLGHGRLLDHMLLDGLEDGRLPGTQMGQHAEKLAVAEGFSRTDQDAYAAESLNRARAASAGHDFDPEIAGVETRDSMGEVRMSRDEVPQSLDPNRIGELKPAFQKDGTITPASASALADGAAALVLARESVARRRGLAVWARVAAQAGHSQAPEWFTTAPVPAIERVLGEAGWGAQEVDLYEINEAFAAVPMAAMRRLDLPAERVNVHGGACALGHPIGATGARLLVTLLYALYHKGLKRGVAALCIGGGEATAMALERP